MSLFSCLELGASMFYRHIIVPFKIKIDLSHPHFDGNIIKKFKSNTSKLVKSLTKLILKGKNVATIALFALK
jgi:hypothetical protein